MIAGNVWVSVAEGSQSAESMSIHTPKGTRLQGEKDMVILATFKSSCSKIDLAPYCIH